MSPQLFSEQIVFHKAERQPARDGDELALFEQPAGLPTAPRSRCSSAERTSSSRSIPIARSFFAVTGPTPESASTGSSRRNSSIRPGGITVSPSGFFQPEAILARNLLGATPAEALRFGCSRITPFIFFATLLASAPAP